MYQGPTEHVLDFFASMGFKCPERKSVADFLQEVISVKDQQVWVTSAAAMAFAYHHVMDQPEYQCFTLLWVTKCDQTGLNGPSWYTAMHIGWWQTLGQV